MRVWPFVIGLVVVPSLAFGQDYTAGKTPPQLFASDCMACHQSPKGLAKGKDARSLTDFLREHYTTKAEAAEALAAFLTGSGSNAPIDPKNAKQAEKEKPEGKRKPPGVPGAVGASASAGGAGEENPPPAGRKLRTGAKPPSSNPPGDNPPDIVAPEGEGAKPRTTATAPEGQKPVAEAKPPKGQRGKKPAVVIDEVKTSEDAAARSRVRAYATTGEEAKPKSNPPAAEPARSEPAPGLAPGG